MPKRQKKLYDGKSEPYVMVWDASQGKPRRRHQLEAESLLGRSLREGEVVHHKDGNPANNTQENLRVLPSQRHHMVLEHFQRREDRGVQHLWGVEEFLAVIK